MAKSVIASAERLIEFRHDCRASSKIEEMSVPPCPIPIHHTKFTMSKPQATGMLMPQMPTPDVSRYPTVTSISVRNAAPIPKPIHQPRVVGFHNT